MCLLYGMGWDGMGCDVVRASGDVDGSDDVDLDLVVFASGDVGEDEDVDLD